MFKFMTVCVTDFEEEFCRPAWADHMIMWNSLHTLITETFFKVSHSKIPLDCQIRLDMYFHNKLIDSYILVEGFGDGYILQPAYPLISLIESRAKELS